MFDALADEAFCLPLSTIQVPVTNEGPRKGDYDRNPLPDVT